MDLDEYRHRIDGIDEQLVRLFCKRMDTAAEIAAWKKEQGSPVFDPERERKKLLGIAASVPEKMRGYTASLYSLLFELSRSYQSRLTGAAPASATQCQSMTGEMSESFPADASVACQESGESFTEIACDKLFSHPDIHYFSDLDAVFSAIDSGLCRYGVVPLESGADSICSVYDRIMRHGFCIVRSVRIERNRDRTEAAPRNADGDFARFLCISQKPEIYPGADRVSLAAVLPREPGALCRILSRFCTFGFKLNRLEGRPLPGRRHALGFYFDLENSAGPVQLLQLVDELPALCEEIFYLGSYSEVV